MNDSWPSEAITSWNVLPCIERRESHYVLSANFFFFSLLFSVYNLIISSIKKADVIPSDDKQVLGFETSSRCEVFLDENRGAFDVHRLARFSVKKISFYKRIFQI